MTSQIPKIQIRGSLILVFAAIFLSVTSISYAKNLSQKKLEEKTAIQQDITEKQTINIESLQNQEKSLKIKSDALNEEVNLKKKEEVTKFDKDIFTTNLSVFATANDLELYKLHEEPVISESDGFYKVKYNISLNGSMYGILNFFNLVEGLGSQYSVDYFSFRQEGAYNWLKREVDVKDLLPWVGIAKETIDVKQLKEIIDLNTKVEKNDYDYGVPISAPELNPNFNPLVDNVVIVDDMFQQETDKEKQKEYESNKKEQEAKTKEALAKKEEDVKKINDFLEKYYPEGTIIKEGQLIVPMLDGDMIFDASITFTGNIAGAEPKININQYLVSSEAITSEDRNVSISWNGEERFIPSIIQGVDVSGLNGLIINENTQFTVSWNNNLLSKSVIESFLYETKNGVTSELNKVASEIKFMQQYNSVREEIELKEYLIFLYEFQQEQNGLASYSGV